MQAYADACECRVVRGKVDEVTGENAQWVVAPIADQKDEKSQTAMRDLTTLPCRAAAATLPLFEMPL